MRYSKWIVALVVILNAAFAAAVLCAFIKVGSEPAVLIGAWFAFTTGELWMLAGITKAKVKHKYRITRIDQEGGEPIDNRNQPEI